MPSRCRCKSAVDSPGMTASSARRPCLNAPRLDAALPRSVFGPRLTIGIRLEMAGKKGQEPSVTPDVDNYLTD